MPTLGSETTQRSRRRRTIRKMRATTRNTWTVRRATGGPKTGSRTCTVPCGLWTNPRLPSTLGNRTRISPHGGLPAKQDSKSGKTDGNQKKRKHQDRDHQNQRRSQEPCRRATYILPQKLLEVTQCDDDFFARQDQNMNGPNWMTNPTGWTNINELKSWTTTHLEWEANERN